MYSAFLAQLLASPDRILKVKDIEVTGSAIRAGLNSALLIFNQSMSLMEIPPVDGTISVSKPNAQGVITIKVIAASQAKFSFTIVAPDGAGDNNDSK